MFAPGSNCLVYFIIYLIKILLFSYEKEWAQGDLNPRPTAPQAAILSKLNYEPMIIFEICLINKIYNTCYFIPFLRSQHSRHNCPLIFHFGLGLYLKNLRFLLHIEQ